VLVTHDQDEALSVADRVAAIPGAAGQVTVLIRPEQIDVMPNEDGLTAHVTSYRYHGHDAVLHVRLQDETGADGSEPVVVRIIGGSHRPAAPRLSVGAVVTLRARGPVFAWPAD
jgi:ABC-type Fe3+/spermidine/putrescine transport system ATPase subunit